ncbi:tyrosine-type recombinase/integrase [Caballeronia sp. S22]|uniref:tyrosine-type recombinase/integrase n=1 Tax=Caballeronia sp. S22 TaxID=3137182 RepID=UPI00353141C1
MSGIFAATTFEVENKRKFSRGASVTFHTKDDVLKTDCPADKPSIEVWHDEVEGFGVRVMRRNKRTGKTRRTYLARYKERKNKDGQTIVADTKKPIGDVSKTGFDDAKNEVLRLRGAASEKRKSLPATARTLKEAYEEYMAVRAGLIADDTVTSYAARMELVEDWLDIPLKDISEDMLTQRYLEVHAEHPRTAKMLVAVLHAISKREVRARRLEHNAVAFVTGEHKVYEKSRSDPHFIRERDMPKFWQYIHTRLHPCARDYMLVMLFTGFRESLAGSLNWDDYDFERQTYRVRAEAKGNKKKETFYFPIPDYLAKNVFEKRAEEQRSQYDGKLGKWVIESYRRRGRPYKDARGAFTAIARDIFIALSDHDFRDTFATIARRVTKDTLLVSRLLTHNLKATDFLRMGTTTDYIGVEEDEFRVAVESVSAGILKAAGVIEQPSAA